MPFQLEDDIATMVEPALSNGDMPVMNHNLLSVAAAVYFSIVCGGGVTLPQTPPPSSLVDYLKSRGQPFTFEARKALWTTWGDGKAYSGSESQNIRLRNLLVADEYAPTLTLSKDVYAQGEQVILAVGGKQQAAGFESDLRLQSGAVKDNKIQFGMAKAGAYGCRVFTDCNSSAPCNSPIRTATE